MYKQSLVEIIEPIKKTTITRMNRGNKWSYGYNKEHDVVVVSKTGKVGNIIKIQDLKIALPLQPKEVYKHEDDMWVKQEYPKQLSRLKNIFDWEVIQMIRRISGTII